MTDQLAAVLAQSQPEDTSSAAAAVLGVFLLVGILSIFALTKRGQRTLLPIIAILIGLSIVATTIADARNATVSALTVLGLFFGGLLVFGGAGALREGVALPQVEPVEPTIDPQPPRATPDD
jgi:FtsH-binding integral membrane protein